MLANHAARRAGAVIDSPTLLATLWHRTTSPGGTLTAHVSCPWRLFNTAIWASSEARDCEVRRAPFARPPVELCPGSRSRRSQQNDADVRSSAHCRIVVHVDAPIAGGGLDPRGQRALAARVTVTCQFLLVLRTAPRLNTKHSPEARGPGWGAEGAPIARLAMGGGVPQVGR